MGLAADLAADVIYQQYLQQVNNLRNGLLGNGPVNGTNAGDNETKDYYNKVAVLGAAMTGLEVAQQTLMDKKTDNYYKGLEDYSKQWEVEMKPPDEVETGVTQFPVETPQPKIKAPDSVQEFIDKNNEVAPDVEKYFKANNVNTYDLTNLANNDTPSEPGQAVPGHSGEYGQTLSNSLKFVVPDGKGGSQTYFKSWVLPNGQPDPNTHSTPNEPMTEKINAMLEEKRRKTPGSYKFFIEKLHGKSVDGQFYKKGPIKEGLKRTDLPNRMVFPAYISKFNDSYATFWGDYKFVGRGEKVFAYEETTRTMQLEFYIMSDFSADVLVKAIDDYNALLKDPNASNSNSSLNATTPNLQSTYETPNIDSSTPSNKQATDLEIMKELQRIWPDWGTGTTPDPSLSGASRTGFVQGVYSGTPEMLWSRMTFLAQCCYAWYRKDGKMKEQPFVRVRIGDFFDVVAKIDSLNFTQDEFDMDLNPSVVGVVPMGTIVSMSLTIIHEDEPTSEYPRFYHRADFDTPDTLGYVPESLSENSDTLDSTLDKNKSNSPVAFLSRLSEQGREKLNFPKDIKAVQSSLANFGGSLKGLQGLSSNSLNLSNVEKVKELLSNAKRLADISEKLNVEKLKDVKPTFDLGELKKTIGSMSNSNISDVTSTTGNLSTKQNVITMNPDKVDYTKQAAGNKKLFPQFSQPNPNPPTV